ncbi:MAG: CHRD domain-containing protein [Candidatus Caldarchaeum sp.]
MKSRETVAVAAALAALTLATLLTMTGFGSWYVSPAVGGAGAHNIKLTPFEVVPPVNSQALGHMDLAVFRQKDENGNYRYYIRYELSWMALSSPPERIYLGFAKQGQTGGVLYWICGGGGRPSCPNATWGKLTPWIYVPGDREVTAEDVPGIPSQGVKPGDVEAFFTALYNGAVYVQIETKNFPAGELRGQIVR